MKTIDNYMKAHDGVHLKYKVNIPENPKACLLMVHGLTEHISCYDQQANWLVEKGYVVYRFDLRGHGETEGKKGWVNDYKDFPKDVRTLVLKMKKDFPDLKYFIFGHSLGGFSSVLFASFYPNQVNGLLLSGALSRGYIPNFEEVVQENLPKNSLYSILHKSQMKLFKYHEKIQDYRLPLLLDPEESYPFEGPDMGSDNPEVIRWKEKDLLKLRKLYVRFYHEVVKGLEYLNENPNGVRDSILMMHGESDQIVDFKDSMILYKDTKIHDKELWILPRFMHEILNDVRSIKVLNKMDEWMVERL